MSVEFFSTHIVETGVAISGSILVSSLLLSHLFRRIIGILFFTTSLGFALFFGYIDYIGVGLSAIYALACYKFRFDEKSISNTLLGVFIFFASIAFFLHLVPGFYNPIVIDNIQVSLNAPLYTQYLNFDKALVGFCLLLYVVSRPKVVPYEQYLMVVGACSLAYAAAFLIALTTGLVQLDIKFPDYLLTWCLINLFITTYAEEAFFRGFVQKVIFDRISHKNWGALLTVLLSGSLFGLAHYPGGIVYMCIATLLGCTFAFCYMRSKNILTPIIAHFIFNLIHFTVFTYPFILEV